MFLLIVYIPIDAVAQVKKAIFDAGAGNIGRYSQCCWQTQGTGQFMGEASATPHIGKTQQLESVDEIKVECLCPEKAIDAIIDALIAAHPYETPAFAYWPVKTHA